MDQVTLEIDKDVPIPKRQTGSHNGFAASLRATLSQMSIGDSFAYPDPTNTKGRRVAVRLEAKVLGIKITQRKVGPQEYRVWRIG